MEIGLIIGRCSVFYMAIRHKDFEFVVFGNREHALISFVLSGYRRIISLLWLKVMFK